MVATDLTDDLSGRPVPEAIPGFADPYELAYLRGGVDEVIRLAVFELVRRRALSVTERPRSLHRERRLRQARQISDLSRVEAAVFRFVRGQPEADEVFSPPLRDEVAAFCTHYRRALRDRGFLRTNGKHRAVVAAFCMAAACASLFAFSAAGIGLAAIVAAAGAILVGWWGPVFKVTGAGRRAVRAARADYGSTVVGDIGPAAVALFGLGILEATKLDVLPLMLE